jgi:enamine deaminase RidA (YjgF/YER057c/UK114 family)
VTTTIEQAIQKIEAALAALETDVVGYVKDTVEPAVEAEFAALKPQILGLGETVLSQVWAAASSYLASGGSASAAVASVVSQLPADLQALEHLVMAAFAGAVQSIAKPVTPAA